MSGKALEGFNISKEAVRKIIEETVRNQGPSLSKKAKERCESTLKAVIEEGKSLKEALKVSDEDFNSLYIHGRTLFEAGKYLEAWKVFDLLVDIEPANPMFLKSLAVTQHRLGDYQEAFSSYAISFYLDESDLMSLFYAYDCLFKLGDFAFAAQTLKDVISRAENRPKYAEIRKQAVLLLDGLNGKLNSDLNK